MKRSTMKSEAQVRFVHLKDYLLKITALPIFFIMQDNYITIDFLTEKKFRRVILSNEILENNFRMIDTYIPELLAALFERFSGFTIKGAINEMSKQPIFYKDENVTKLYLKHKLFQLFEGIFFGLLLDGVWKGGWKQKIYALKNGTALKYYSMLEARDLFNILLERVIISSSLNNNLLSVSFRYTP